MRIPTSPRLRGVGENLNQTYCYGLRAATASIETNQMASVSKEAFRVEFEQEEGLEGEVYDEAEFERANAPLTHAQRASYDAAARFCARRLKPELLSAVAATGAPTASLMREYWACHQRFFQQLLVGMKVRRAPNK